MTDPRINITHHAALRYCERVDPSLSPIEAIALLRRHVAAISIAATFGCGVIRLGNGARLILSGWDVVTVLGRSQFPPFPAPRPLALDIRSLA